MTTRHARSTRHSTMSMCWPCHPHVMSTFSGASSCHGFCEQSAHNRCETKLVLKQVGVWRRFWCIRSAVTVQVRPPLCASFDGPYIMAHLSQEPACSHVSCCFWGLFCARRCRGQATVKMFGKSFDRWWSCVLVVIFMEHAHAAFPDFRPKQPLGGHLEDMCRQGSHFKRQVAASVFKWLAASGRKRGCEEKGSGNQCPHILRRSHSASRGAGQVARPRAASCL